MNELQIISLLLLIPIVLDAVGDALRFRNKQKLHHAAEVLHVGFWLFAWAYLGFHWGYVIMYVLARVVLFDVVFNAFAKLKIGYVGESSIYGWLVSWISSKAKEPNFLVWVIRVMALIAWIGLFFTWRPMI